MSKASFVALCRIGALSCALGSTLVACQKDEPPPPLPEPKAVETAAEAPLELKPEDAGAPVVVKPPVAKSGGGSSAGSLAKCCAALRQNATSAPPPTKDYMMYAAGVCDLAASQGKDKASAVGVIASALKGAGMPAACK